MFRGIHVALLALALIACGHRGGPRVKTPGPRLPDAKGRTRTPPPPPEWFWQPTYAEVRPAGRKPLDLPVRDVDRLEGAGRIWDDLSVEARERLKKDGLLVLASESPRSMGAFYTDLRDQRVPHVITLDALFYLVHVGMERTLAELDELELVPALHTLLEKLDVRLGREETGAGTELAQAYRIAHGIVAVARTLEAPRPLTGELGAIVTDEKARIEAHAGPAASPLLGVTLDYASFAVPKASAHPGAFRALAWLASAPLGVVARSEAKTSPIGVARARTNTRAAMLLARVCDREIDASIHAAYGRVLRLLSFVWGAPDDLALTDLDELADAAGIDLTKPENVASVVRVDRVRARAAAGRAPQLDDGNGTGRGAISVRMFGGNAPVDAVALQALSGKQPPSTLDVAAWLGVPEARILAREGARSASFDELLAKVQQATPIESPIHASVQGSLLEALASWARTEDTAGFADDEAVDQRGGWGIPRTSARERARVESILAAWTLLRHSSQPLTRPRPPAPSPSKELRVTGAPLPVFVEPLPDAIARLVSAVRQLRRGLESRLGPGSGAMTGLAETEDMLSAAQTAAERHASDEPLTAEETTALAALPARLARIEDESGGPRGPVSVTVHTDVAARRRLLSVTGAIEPVLMLAHDPARDAPMLVVGAHVAQQEVVENAGKRTPAKRPTWTASFRWSR